MFTGSASRFQRCLRTSLSRGQGLEREEWKRGRGRGEEEKRGREQEGSKYLARIRRRRGARKTTLAERRGMERCEKTAKDEENQSTSFTT